MCVAASHCCIPRCDADAQCDGALRGVVPAAMRWCSLAARVEPPALCCTSHSSRPMLAERAVASRWSCCCSAARGVRLRATSLWRAHRGAAISLPLQSELLTLLQSALRSASPVGRALLAAARPVFGAASLAARRAVEPTAALRSRMALHCLRWSRSRSGRTRCAAAAGAAATLEENAASSPPRRSRSTLAAVAGRIEAPPLIAAVIRDVVATAVACSRSMRISRCTAGAARGLVPLEHLLACASMHRHSRCRCSRSSSLLQLALCSVLLSSTHLSLQRDCVIVAGSIHSLRLVTSSSNGQHRLAHGLRAFVALPPFELLADLSRWSIYRRLHCRTRSPSSLPPWELQLRLSLPPIECD